MGKLEEYIESAKALAEAASDAAKTVAGEVMDRAKDLSEEKGKVRELTQSAK